MAKKIQSKRNFRKLRCSMTMQKFLEFCEDVSIQYAIRDPIYSRKYYTERCLITDECFNKILAYSVICNIVEDDIVDKMEKSALMYLEFFPDGYEQRIRKHYENIREMRHKYIVATFPNEKAIKMIKYYSSSTNISKNDLAEIYKVNISIVDSILKKTIARNIISDDLLEKLEKICILKDPGEKTISFFERLREERNFRRTALE